jgi:acyl-CoA synthetase (AMP-forming)/AMP-acid ligase II
VVNWQQAAAEIVDILPHRIHEVMDPYIAASPDRTALIDDKGVLTYRELDRAVGETVDMLRALGIRCGDRMMLVSENSIPLACLLFAASRLDVWAIVANPRLSPRELDQIRDHSGARRMLFMADVSDEAAVHTTRYDTPVQDVGPLRGIGVSALNQIPRTKSACTRSFDIAAKALSKSSGPPASKNRSSTPSDRAAALTLLIVSAWFRPPVAPKRTATRRISGIRSRSRARCLPNIYRPTPVAEGQGSGAKGPPG